MSQLIISLGREFGSGGHEIAEKLAKHYDIPLLDHRLLDEIAMDKNVNPEEYRELDELRRRIPLSRTVRGFNSSLEDNLSLIQFEYLEKKAEAGESFVVVGRCSESILKDHEATITIFVLGDKDNKVERIKRLYELPDKLAEKLIKEKDMQRKRYHNSFCDGKWGDSRNYDISINSKMGTDKTAQILIHYIDMVRK